ncbi:MAG: sugar transferase, partial [Anaerolineales bacterium]
MAKRKTESLAEPAPAARSALRLRPAERRLILFAGDLLAGGAAMLLALALWAQFDWFGLSADFVRFRAEWFVFTPLAWVVLLANLYDVHRASSWRETWTGIGKAALAGLFLYLIVYFALAYFNPAETVARRGVLYFLILAVAFTLLWRRGYIAVFSAPAFQRRALIVGAGETGRTLLRALHQMNPAPYAVIGVVDDDRTKFGKSFEGARIVGDSDSLPRWIREEGVTDLLFAIVGPMNGGMIRALLEAQERGVEITRMAAAYEEILNRVPIRHLEADWLLRSFVDEVRVSSFYLAAKRLIDMAGAALGLAVFLLVLPVVALAILVESGRPIFFSQPRLGQGGRVFDVMKLRTMHQAAEADGRPRWARESDPRATQV